MKVTVRMGAPLSRLVGESRVILSLDEGTTLAGVLAEMQARYPDFEEGLKGKGLVKPFDRAVYALFVNSRPVALADAPATPLRDGDRVQIFLPVAGG